MSDFDQQNQKIPKGLVKYGMMACCAVMLVPVAGIVIAGGSISTLWANTSALAPIALCLGAHVLMFKVMAKSCHGSKDEKVQADVTDVEFSDRPHAVQRVGQKSLPSR
jgi:hypothetical protein